MDYDNILKDIGEFGLYQRRVYFMICLINFPHLFNAIGYVFWAARIDHWCHVDRPLGMENVSDELWKNWTIPLRGTSDGPGGRLVHDSCSRYAYTDNMTAVDIDNQGFGKLYRDWRNDTGDSIELRPCESWDFDTSQYMSTIVSKFSLVCERQWLISTTQSVYMAGRMVGAILFGFLADRFGRRPVILLSLLFEVFSSIGIAFAPNIQTFFVLRCICAACSSGSYVISFIFVVEIVGPSWRVFTGIVWSLWWAGCYMLLPLIAYFIRDYVKLMLAFSVPSLSLGVLYWVIPESPRWLLLRQKNIEAMALIKKIARVNRKSLPEGYSVIMDPGSLKDREEQSNFSEFLRSLYIWKMTLVLSFLWFSTTFVYYGLSLNSANLSGNDYLNVFFAGAVEIPAYLTCHVMFVHLGRPGPLSAMNLLAGMSLLAIIWVPPANYTCMVILVSIGKFAVTCTFGMIYIYTSELFPTAVRSIIIGLCNTTARISGALAPFAADLGAHYPAVPYIIFGGLAIVACVLVLTLPETKGISLPQTLQEGKLLAQQPTVVYRCWQMLSIRKRKNRDKGIKELKPLNH